MSATDASSIEESSPPWTPSLIVTQERIRAELATSSPAFETRQGSPADSMKRWATGKGFSAPEEDGPKDAPAQHRRASFPVNGNPSLVIKKSGFAQHRSGFGGQKAAPFLARNSILQPQKAGTASIAPTDMEFDLEEMHDPRVSRMLHSKSLWKLVVALIWFVAFLAASITVRMKARTTTVAFFALWQWGFFLAGLGAIYIVSALAGHIIVYQLEYTYLSARMMYWLYRLRKPLIKFMRALLLLPLFLGCFHDRQETSGTWHGVYAYGGRTLACVALFFFGNVLKSLGAKLMAGSFHRASQFAKMQEGLRREYFLRALSMAPPPDMGPLATLDTARTADWANRALNSHTSLPKDPDANGLSNDDTSGVIGGVSMIFMNPNVPEADLKSPFEMALESPMGSPTGTHEPLDVILEKESGGFDAQPSMPTSVPTSIPATEADSKVSVRPSEQHVTFDETPSSRPITIPQALSSRSLVYQRSAVGPSLAYQRSTAGPSLAHTRSTVGPSASRNYTRRASMVVRRAPSSARFVHEVRPTRSRRVSFVVPPEDGEGAWDDGHVTPAALAFAEYKDDEPEDKLRTRDSERLKLRKSKEINIKMHKLEKYFRNNKLTLSFTDEMGEAVGSDGELNSRAEAKRVAFYFFYILKPQDVERSYLVEEDLHRFLDPEEATEAFQMLDEDGDEKVTIKEMRETIMKIYKERKHLALQLKDTKTVVGKLEFMCGVAIHLIFILIYLVIFHVPASLWVTIISIMAGVSWVFGSSVAAIYAATVYLFVVHPFDVGDMLLLGPTSTSLNQIVWVEEIALVACVVRRWDGARLWWPTSMLSNTPIVNLSRSDNKWEAFQMYVDVGTPAEMWDILRKEVETFIEGHRDNFGGKSAIYCFGAADPLKLSVQVVVEYSFDGSDLDRLNEARHDVCMLINRVLGERGVRYSMPTFNGGGALMPPRAQGAMPAGAPEAPPPPSQVHHGVAVAMEPGWLPHSGSQPLSGNPLPGSRHW